MTDFGDSTFVSTHCFGYDITDDGNYTIHFLPLDSVAVPDIEGMITLDTAKLIVQKVSVRLTRAQEVAPGFEQLHIEMVYRELFPRIAVAVGITSEQRFHRSDGVLVVARERQSIQALRFLRLAPDGAAVKYTFRALP
jgi:hypothetical protein